MHDLESLKARVEATAGRLIAAQQGRRQQNQSLLEILGRLEQKFAAQEQELEFYRGRVRPLETANEQLAALMQRLLDMVEAGLTAADDAQDPVRRAREIAAAMLEHDLAPEPGAVDQSLATDQAVGADPTALAADAVAQERFEDVEDERLEAELAAEAQSGEEEFPEIVRAAMAVANDVAEPETVESLAATLVKEVGGSDPLQPTAADIRALLERVEAAAARLGAETDGESDTVPPPPGRRLAGAA